MLNKSIFKVSIPLLLIIAGYIYITQTFTDLGTTLFAFSLSFAFTFFALLFASENVFSTWKKFTVFWVPMSILLIVISPMTSRELIGFDKELTALWTAGLFFLISLAIIGFKSWKLK